MPSDILYEISVDCQTINFLIYNFKAVLKIRKEDQKYIVTIFFKNIGELILSEFLNEIEAYIYLHKSMKLAMHCKLLYNFCSICQKCIFFPSNSCSDCLFSILENKKWLNNYENEKITEHLGLKMKWNANLL